MSPSSAGLFGATDCSEDNGSFAARATSASVRSDQRVFANCFKAACASSLPGSVFAMRRASRAGPFRSGAGQLQDRPGGIGDAAAPPAFRRRLGALHDAAASLDGAANGLL